MRLTFAVETGDLVELLPAHVAELPLDGLLLGPAVGHRLLHTIFSSLSVYFIKLSTTNYCTHTSINITPHLPLKVVMGLIMVAAHNYITASSSSDISR